MQKHAKPAPDVEDVAPKGAEITAYDQAHFVTYLRLLDAEAEGAVWEDVARIVLHRDPLTEPERTRSCWESHLTWAHWLSRNGYQYMLRQ